MDTQIQQKLVSIEKKVDKLIEVQARHSKVLDEHTETLQGHTEQIDFLAEKSLEHQERMDAFEVRMDNFERRTEENFVAVRNEAQSNFDAIMTILKRLDEDRFASHSRLLRIEQHIGLS